jgi:S-adenosyl-L-methionine hydrolase (adenosine-forming)
MPSPVISLITDFGTAHHLVGSMKGVILKINPEAQIIDITHEIPPYDIVQASYVLQSVINYFPVPTVHLVVVDPGVGSERKPIIAVGEKHYYIAPDNGIISRVVKEDNITKVYQVEGDHYMLKRACETFHGRDVFAPVAAWLSKYCDATLFGDETDTFKTVDISRPMILKDQTVKCQVLFVDNFGNLVTNFETNMLDTMVKKFQTDKIRVKVGETVISGIKTHYYEVPNPLDPLALFGSMDLLEISVREGDAAETLCVKTGDPVYLKFGD